MYVVLEDLGNEASDAEQLVCYCADIEEAREVAEDMRGEGKDALILMALALYEADSPYTGPTRRSTPACAMQCMREEPDARLLQ